MSCWVTAVVRYKCSCWETIFIQGELVGILMRVQLGAQKLGITKGLLSLTVLSVSVATQKGKNYNFN